MKQENGIVHVHIKSTSEDAYFGCLSAIYDRFTRKDIGLCLDGLYRTGLSKTGFFENKKCIIRKGILHRKDTKRGNEGEFLL